MDFLNDRPRRVMRSFEVPQKVVLFMNPAFFCQRDCDMNTKKKVSQRVIGDVHDAFSDRVIVVLYTRDDEWMLSALQARFEVFLIEREKPVESTNNLRLRLRELGIRFTTGPTRQMSWITVDKFTVGDSLKCVKRDDFAALGIKPDKELTFQDLAVVRARTGWP